MADTPERMKAIYDRIAATMNTFTEDEQDSVASVNAYIEEQKGKDIKDYVIYERAIRSLIQKFGGLDVHETFEYGTGFDTLSDPLDDD